MHNFKILTNQGQYQVCDHPFKLLPTGATTIKEQLIPSIPLKAFKFNIIKDIIEDNYLPDLLVGRYK